MKTKNKKKINKKGITEKVKKTIIKKKKEIKAKKIKADIKSKIEKGVKSAKKNSAKTLEVLTKVGISAKEKALIAGEELTKASKVAKINAQRYLEIGKIKAKNVLLTNKINKSFEKVGQIIYNEKINVDNESIKQLINEITVLKIELKKIAEEK